MVNCPAPPARPGGGDYQAITVRGISAHGYHGVFAEEKAAGQPFVADLTYYLEPRHPGVADDLATTVSYAEIAEETHAIIAGQPVDLIEVLAEKIAAQVLSHLGVRAVDVTIHKPQAPITVPFSDVTVTVRRLSPLLAGPVDALTGSRAPARVDIALGSNMGADDAAVRENMMRARTAIGRIRDTVILASSPLARSRAVTLDGEAQPDYLNAVVRIHTLLAPLDLLAELQRIEALAGRVRTRRWQARVLDLDILHYGDLISDDPQLTLPHPLAEQRAFVQVPLAWMAGESASAEGVERLPADQQWPELSPQVDARRGVDAGRGEER